MKLATGLFGRGGIQIFSGFFDRCGETREIETQSNCRAGRARRKFAADLPCFFKQHSLGLSEEKTNRRCQEFEMRLVSAPIASTIFVFLAFSNTTSRAASFTPLGDLDGGPFRSFARAVSDDGATVVGASRIEDFKDQAYAQLLADPGLTIVEASHDLFERGIRLFADRPDKSWSLTDCISFVVMDEHGISAALTADHHFEQAGYTPVLKS